MLTQNERDKLESEWGEDERLGSIIARIAIGVALLLLIASFTWIDDSAGSTGNEGAVDTATPAWRPPHEGSALRASRHVFEERRAQFDTGSDQTRRADASR